MKDNDKSFLLKLSVFCKKYKNIISIILCFIFLFLLVNNEFRKINLKSNGSMIIIGIIFLLIIFIILYEIRIIKKILTFNEKELIVTGKIFSAEAYRIKYSHDDIYRYIIGRFYNKYFHDDTIYHIYIDEKDQIKKIYSVKTYKECLDIIEEIKKTGVKIYDDTEALYLREDDLFRNYYKLKKTFEDFTNENSI